MKTASRAITLLLCAPLAAQQESRPARGTLESRPASTASRSRPPRSIDDVVLPFLATGKVLGLAVGVVSGPSSVVWGYGKTAATGADVDSATLFEIGSVTKAFTGVLLALMVEDGSVKLSTPARELLPPNAEFPSRAGREITLLDLATHSSSLPRLPRNLRPKDPLDPYADYTVENLYASLGEIHLPRDIGAGYEYSNLGFGLLGHLLARRAGKDYEDLIRSRICTPLGLHDTVITLSSEQRQRVATGHLPTGRPAKNWHLPTLAGAGALWSSADDMTRFLAHNLAAGDGALARALAAARAEHRPSARGAPALGLGWHRSPLDPGGRVMTWHNGGTGGFRSFIGFVSDPPVGVVVLGNSTESVDPVAVSLLRLRLLEKR